MLPTLNIVSKLFKIVFIYFTVIISFKYDFIVIIVQRILLFFFCPFIPFVDIISEMMIKVGSVQISFTHFRIYIKSYGDILLF